MNGVEMLAALVDHVGGAFDVDPALICVQTTNRNFALQTGKRRELLAVLRMPPDTEAGRIVMAFLAWTLQGGEWVLTEAMCGPVK